MESERLFFFVEKSFLQCADKDHVCRVVAKNQLFLHYSSERILYRRRACLILRSSCRRCWKVYPWEPLALV